MVNFCVLSFVLVGFVYLIHCCDDLDTQACEFMAISRPDICSDKMIGKSACPKFCNLCPIKCYNCNSTLPDYHLCTTTVTCQEDEVCMRRELRSFIDGHREFEMTCAKKTFCDDPWQGISMFGKRVLESRDISVSCCTTDLCNYPVNTTTSTATITTSTTATTSTATTTSITTTTTTMPSTPSTTTAKDCTGCCVDLMIAVDESGSIEPSTVKSFLLNVVSSLPINSSSTLVSLGLFDTAGRTIFNIGDHVTKSSIQAAINTMQFKGGHGIVSAGVDYLLKHAVTPAGGDRPDYPNVVLILSDDLHPHVLNSLEHELHSKTSHVIYISVGYSRLHNLASSSEYDINIHDLSELNKIDTDVVNLICGSIHSHSQNHYSHLIWGRDNSLDNNGE